MALQLPSRREPIRIDTSIAIVNIVLLLLFFFLITGQTTVPENEIELSQTSDLPLEQLPSPILIVNSAEEWQLDGVAVSPELLPAAMSGQGQVLHLLIDRAAPASLLIETLNAPALSPYQLRLVTLNSGDSE